MEALPFFVLLAASLLLLLFAFAAVAMAMYLRGLASVQGEWRQEAATPEAAPSPVDACQPAPLPAMS